MVPKPDQARIKALLTEAITVLCKNGLGYEYNCGIQGLLGITLDDEDVFLVDLKESIVKKERPQPEPVEERSPTPVEPLSPSRVSSPAGQFIGRKRRRSGSTATDASSPAKRPSYSEDQGDDVIVIKEEGIDQDGGDMYDSGGGNGHQMPHDESYGVTLQDDPGDYGGAGCSQWETSSSSSQSAWPQVAQFDTTQQLHQQQQQQQIASSSSSSSLMTPTQVSALPYYARHGYPAPKIHSDAICATLQGDICEALLAEDLSVSAFRMNWQSSTDEKIQRIWDDIVCIRNHLDQLAQQIPGTLFIASSVHGTKVKRKARDYKINPSVAYWIVSTCPITSIVHSYMNANQYAAVVKFSLQPFQSADPVTVGSVLTSALKDSMEGCVPMLVEDSCKKLYGTVKPDEPVCKFYVGDQAGPKDIIEKAVFSLQSLLFNTVLQTF